MRTMTNASLDAIDPREELAKLDADLSRLKDREEKAAQRHMDARAACEAACSTLDWKLSKALMDSVDLLKTREHEHQLAIAELQANHERRALLQRHLARTA